MSMKIAKPPAAPDGRSSSSRRSQPLRQTRTNPPRANAGFNRTSLSSLTGPAAREQPIDIFPAVTHFADAITALPKELVRHFTLLKEVDAKIFAPQEALFQLIEAALKQPVPTSDTARLVNDGANSVAPTSAPMSVQNSSNSRALTASTWPNDNPASVAATTGSNNSLRLQLFYQIAVKIQEMLVSLEEKNHVISTANEVLQKQNARIEDIWPHLENEFSDEAKWGSNTHWAYASNRLPRGNNAQAERSRREGAATLSAAAQQLADEAAARSESRKQAVAAKKVSRNHHAESDLDTRPGEGVKKASRPRAQKSLADSPANVGLGITAPLSSNGAPDKKRRKVEKPANGNLLPERAMASVFGTGAAKPKTASPRETPAPDGQPKKRKALPTSGNQAKRSRAANANSPSVASSPIIGSFPDSVKLNRNSPAPSAVARPSSSRVRNNSTAQENGRSRAPSAASIKPNGISLVAELPKVENIAMIVPDAKARKESNAAPKPDATKVESEAETPRALQPLPNGVPSEPTKAAEDRETSVAKKDVASPILPPVPAPTVTTKSGRASKPSTPALGTFAEAVVPKPRPSRASETVVTTVKRSHKKGASQSAAAMQAIMAHAVQPPSRVANNSKKQDGRPKIKDDEDEAENDDDEPKYCYCHQVSYGEMVACDDKNCEKEWFHLGCVGLKVAPEGEWFCPDCRKRHQLQGRRRMGGDS